MAPLRASVHQPPVLYMAYGKTVNTDTYNGIDSHTWDVCRLSVMLSDGTLLTGNTHHKKKFKKLGRLKSVIFIV